MAIMRLVVILLCQSVFFTARVREMFIVRHVRRVLWDGEVLLVGLAFKADTNSDE